jgi:mono/diheme cytochrome c family protein
MAARTFIGLCLIGLLAGCNRHLRQVRVPDAEPGSAQFRAYCAGCHQHDGQGGVEAPPLAGSVWVTGPQDRLIRIVLHGVRGPMEVRGQSYDREMPGFGHVLSDTDIGSLLTFIRQHFGAPSEPVTPAAVNRVRAANQTRTDYWRVDELLQ